MTLALRGLTMALLLALAAITFTPLVWLLAAVLKAPEYLFSYTFFSPNPSLKNFYDLFTQVDFLRFAANSVFVACTGVVIQHFFSFECPHRLFCILPPSAARTRVGGVLARWRHNRGLATLRASPAA